MNILNFKILNIITFGLSITLFIFLLIIPEPIFLLFNVEGNEVAYFFCRRAAMLFGGYAVISFCSKDMPLSLTRQAISLGIALSMLGFSVLGTFEFIRGFAGGGIFFAISGEFFLAVSYFTIWLSDRKELHNI